MHRTLITALSEHIGRRATVDLIFRGLELVTGGQRLHHYADYEGALADRGEPTEPYESYLRTFQHGMPPHGGFALGLERWTTRLIEADNIGEQPCSRAISLV